jgi:uncharacterized protein (DUF1499 family)
MDERRAPRLRNVLGLAAATAFLGGPALAALRLVPGLVGFVLFAVGGIMALVVALVSIVQASRGRRLTAGGAAAMAVGVVFVILATRGSGHPRINDFTTDLADPPAFRHAATLPPNAGRDLGYPPDFAPVQTACCPDLRAAHLAVPPVEAFARARRTAGTMPRWQITAEDPAAGTIEAVVTSGLFGFQDDVVIRVRPDGARASRVDVRSKSRDGQGDLGANAARIHAYVAALEAAPS